MSALVPKTFNSQERILNTSTVVGRLPVKLPVIYQYQFEALGITWFHPINRTSQLADALLPQGWKLRESNENLNLVDAKGNTRVCMWFKDDDIDAIFVKPKEPIEAEELNKERSEKWTAEKSYASLQLIYKESFSNPHQRFCHGFFATYELAKRVKKFLDEKFDKTSTNGDKSVVFFWRFESPPEERLKKIKYSLINDFVDEY